MLLPSLSMPGFWNPHQPKLLKRSTTFRNVTALFLSHTVIFTAAFMSQKQPLFFSLSHLGSWILQLTDVWPRAYPKLDHHVLHGHWKKIGKRGQEFVMWLFSTEFKAAFSNFNFTQWIMLQVPRSQVLSVTFRSWFMKLHQSHVFSLGLPIILPICPVFLK